MIQIHEFFLNEIPYLPAKFTYLTYVNDDSVCKVIVLFQRVMYEELYASEDHSAYHMYHRLTQGLTPSPEIALRNCNVQTNQVVELQPGSFIKACIHL